MSTCVALKLVLLEPVLQMQTVATMLIPVSFLKLVLQMLRVPEPQTVGICVTPDGCDVGTCVIPEACVVGTCVTPDGCDVGTCVDADLVSQSLWNDTGTCVIPDKLV